MQTKLNLWNALQNAPKGVAPFTKSVAASG